MCIRDRDNRVLIEQLIEKAALCKGLTHREAAILLECNQPDLCLLYTSYILPFAKHTDLHRQVV